MPTTVSLTIRAEIPAQPGAFGQVMAAIGGAGGEVVGVEVVRSTKATVTRDIIVQVRGDEGGEAVVGAISGVAGVKVHDVTDRVLLAHQGGKMAMQNRMALKSRDDLSMAYTPGVARVCMAIHDDPEQVWDLTIRANTVMVVSDGSAVVGEGDLGPEASLPAVEAKCMFLREMAGIDGFPLPVTVRDPDEMVRVLARISSVVGGYHLTDIAEPRCFEIVHKLGAAVDVPVFHDNQEGHAAAMLAAVMNGLELAGKQLSESRLVVCGLGPYGVATVRTMVGAGAGEVIACNRDGAVHSGREGLNEDLLWVAEHTNPQGRTGSVHELMKGADVFIGFSVPGLLTADHISSMAADPVVFALAMPEPEISPQEAAGVARVIGTGRPDAPNQINSTLAFPGIWRGALDCRATRINDEMVMAAAHAIAQVCRDEGLAEDYVVPSVFNKRLVPAVAAAVRRAAEESGVARIPVGAG
jgi:malate dehydrogenase (oxaloacetate-decarboxylating)